MMDRSKNRSAGATKVKPIPSKEGALTRYKYEVGDFSLLISLFVRLLDYYLLVMADITQNYYFNALLSTMMHLWV